MCLSGKACSKWVMIHTIWKFGRSMKPTLVCYTDNSLLLIISFL